MKNLLEKEEGLTALLGILVDFGDGLEFNLLSAKINQELNCICLTEPTSFTGSKSVNLFCLII